MDLKCHINVIQKRLICNVLNLLTVPFNVVAAAVFGAGGVLSVVVIAVVIVAGLLVGVRLVQFAGSCWVNMCFLKLVSQC